MSNKKVDIAIVGGGVSGVYSAWKLQKKHPNKKIVVFEGSDHIGGRLLSVIPPGIPNMVAELGGMRILENTQKLIVKLIDDLNAELPKSRKIKKYDFPVNEPQNIAYLRGVYLRLSDFSTNPDKVPYKLSYLERGNINNIIVNAIEQIVPGITVSTLTTEERLEMTAKATFDDVPLYKWGFWNVLYRVMSGEAYQFCMDSGGYDSIMVNWNAADAIPWFLADFGIKPKYKGFTNGFQQVPIELGNFFEKEGGEIRLNARLNSFEWRDNHFELIVNGETIIADKLILAMPRRALELLEPTCPKLQEINDLIKSVTPRPLFKLFTTYANPWWLSAGYTMPDGTYLPVQAGRTVTDLPVRQTYYWPLKTGKPALSGPGMLLASYDDGSNIGFWDGLRPQRKRSWQEGHAHTLPEDPFTDEDKTVEENGLLNQTWDQYKAPRRVVSEMARQLRQIHNLDYTPFVRNASFRDWGEDPFGGGWNSWNIGVKSAEVRDKITHPIEDCPLYICGEAYSDSQGWVEGALQTADIMLSKFK
jgi:monoamine oxidase